MCKKIVYPKKSCSRSQDTCSLSVIVPGFADQDFFALETTQYKLIMPQK